MTDAGVSTARILVFASRSLLVLKTGRLNLIRRWLEMFRNRGMVQVVIGFLLGNNWVAITTHRLHGNRNSQHVAAE
ncbi:MAG: hypothetical protein OEV15_01165 [Gallionella sp.]|nr:hypothetical protein [Gallionella sp.]